MNDFEKLINKRLYLFDFEVTQYDWLLVIHKYSDNSEIIFHNTSTDEIYSFIETNNPILLGHNARYYDQYILKAILSGFDITEIKAVNDHIINGGQGFELQYEYIENFPSIWDTIQDVVPPKSLKEIEANLLLDITESTISFNIDHEWTKEEYEEMLYYCRHDVDALRPLFEARKSYFKTKYDLCVLSNIDPAFNIGLTNAKLCAKFLEAKQVLRDDEREYTIPESIDTSVIEKEVLDFFNTIHDENIPSEELFKTKLDYNSHGMPCVVSWGGKHGALPNFYYDSREEPNMVVINEDFASLYPHLLALPQYNFISRNIKDKNAYYNTLQHRLELKRQGKKEEQLPLKLILNTTYGCQNNKYNDLFDPKGARGTCISGQLLISELTEKVYAIGDVTLIQVNTDGLMVKLPKSKLPEYYRVSDEFSKKCGIDLEYDIIDKIIQRDVNNYIMIYGDEKYKSIKAKGGCFASLPRLKIEEDGMVSSKYEPNFKANSLAIVSEALAKYLLFNTPIEDTINNENNIHKFQMVQHLGATYEKCVQESSNGDILLQRNNRIYAGLKPSGTIIKVKPNGRRDSLANCPPNPVVDNDNHLIIDEINKEWYIKLATQWANDFKGVKRLNEYKKIELVEMAKDMGLEFDTKIKKVDLIKLIEENKEREINMTKKETVTKKDVAVKSMNIYEKINAMKEDIKELAFVMDQVQAGQLGGKEYPSIGQYYRTITDLSIKYHLLFTWEVMNIDSMEKDMFKPTGKMPQHVTTVCCKAQFFDTDHFKVDDEGGNMTPYIEYYAYASGSDSCDKGTSAASSMAFRNWFDKNFAPSYLTIDEFGGENEIEDTTEKTEEPKVPTYIPQERKEEITKEVVQEVQKEDNNSDDVKKVIDNIMKVRELLGNENWGASTLDKLINGEITSVDLMEIELKVNNKLETLEG